MMLQSTQAVETDNNGGDDGSLLKSLIDRNQRGLTFDLDGNNTMQQSALYSKRLMANSDGRFDQDIGSQEERLPNTNSPARGTTTGSESTTTRENNNNNTGSNKETTTTTTTTATSSSTGDGGLDSVSLSLGNLYVGSGPGQGENEQTSETAAATNSVVPATAATGSSTIPPAGNNYHHCHHHYYYHHHFYYHHYYHHHAHVHVSQPTNILTNYNHD